MKKRIKILFLCSLVGCAVSSEQKTQNYDNYGFENKNSSENFEHSKYIDNRPTKEGNYVAIDGTLGNYYAELQKKANMSPGLLNSADKKILDFVEKRQQIRKKTSNKKLEEIIQERKKLARYLRAHFTALEFYKQKMSTIDELDSYHKDWRAKYVMGTLKAEISGKYSGEQILDLWVFEGIGKRPK